MGSGTGSPSGVVLRLLVGPRRAFPQGRLASIWSRGLDKFAQMESGKSSPRRCWCSVVWWTPAHVPSQIDFPFGLSKWKVDKICQTVLVVGCRHSPEGTGSPFCFFCVSVAPPGWLWSIGPQIRSSRRHFLPVVVTGPSCVGGAAEAATWRQRLCGFVLATRRKVWPGGVRVRSLRLHCFPGLWVWGTKKELLLDRSSNRDSPVWEGAVGDVTNGVGGEGQLVTSPMY